MRRILSLLVFFTLSLTTMAQKKDVTKFLGIPVDGYKSEMKQKLINKGFTYDARNDNFKGEFNGRDVTIFIGTNNNKVWRIMVCDANYCNETDIKIRFNNLCWQFAKNEKKYFPLNGDEKGFVIPDNEDISYEMSVNNKRYEANYYQAPDTSLMNSSNLLGIIQEKIEQKYTQEEISNNINDIIQKETFELLMERMSKKSVWFIISETYGRYYITMFYDNEYNHSNGEDL